MHPFNSQEGDMVSTEYEVKIKQYFYHVNMTKQYFCVNDESESTILHKILGLQRKNC